MYYVYKDIGDSWKEWLDDILNENKTTKHKPLGEYTLNEIKSLCKYVGKTDIMYDCKDCRFKDICATVPNSWKEETLKSDGKKHLSKEEKEDIAKQISELKKRLADDE